MKNSCQFLINDVMYLLTDFDVIVDIDDGIREDFDGLVCINGIIQLLNSGRMTSKDHRETCQNKFGRGEAQELVFDFDL